MVMEVVQEDLGDGSMLCTDHPYKNSTPGGICAFCLQEKLGKLVSSSFPVAVFPSSSSSSSPSFRSEFAGNMNMNMNMNMSMNSSRASSNHIVSFNPGVNREEYYPRRSKMPFVLKKKKQDANSSSSIVFKRSKSTATPRRTRGIHYLDGDGVVDVDADVDDYSPHKKGFWSFLYLSSKNSASSKKGSSHREFGSYPSSVSSVNGNGNVIGNGNGGGMSVMRPREKKREDLVVVEENESPNQAEFDRKVSRSRSVGCGSRSFSGDFFERISTGFGDCTLRRVESQREGKVKGGHSLHRNSTGAGQDCIKERVKCGGIFGGFMITSSSSSSSSSSYLVSSSAEDNINGGNGGGRSGSTPGSVRHLAHGRSKSWGWALASPMRAFSKPSSAKRGGSSKNSTPNLSAIPSLLTVGG